MIAASDAQLVGAEGGICLEAPDEIASRIAEGFRQEFEDGPGAEAMQGAGEVLQTQRVAGKRIASPRVFPIRPVPACQRHGVSV